MRLDTWAQHAISVAAIIVVAIIVRVILLRIISHGVAAAVKRQAERTKDLDSRAAFVMSQQSPGSTHRQSQRATTLGTVLNSIISWTIVIVTLLMVLGELGVNVGPAIASAGIGGIALGFGAQSLIKDVISGIFLVLEDQFGVGDLIKVGALEGTVQAVGFRTTRIQDVSGSIWYIRNGEIVTLGNRTQGWSTSMIGIPVALTSDPIEVVGALSDVADELENDEEWRDQMLEKPRVLGLSSITATEMMFTILVKCPANKQHAVEREVRSRALIALRSAGIKAPDPLTHPPQQPSTSD